MAFEITDRAEYKEYGLVQYDTLPPVKAQFFTSFSKKIYVDLTGMTVNFYFRKADGELINGLAPQCQILDALAGYVQYNWGVNDLANYGIHFGEFELVDSTGRKQTIRNTLRFNVREQLDSVSGV